MALKDKIVAHLKLREGERLQVYLDSLDNPTVGVGHLVRPKDHLVVGDEITPVQSDRFLKADMDKALTAARLQASEMGKETEDFIVALTSVNFQLGTDWPAVFHGSYPKLVSGDWQGAITGFQNSTWAGQTPVRVSDFVKAIEKAYNTEIAAPNNPVVAGGEIPQPKGDNNVVIDFKMFDGYKVHILGVFAIVVGVLKVLTDIPDIEAVSVLNVSDPWTLITTGWATVGGRSLVSKFIK